MDKTTYWKMIDDVARQMCIIAGENPDEMLWCPVSRGETREYINMLARERFEGGVFLKNASYAPHPVRVAFEEVRLPPYTSVKEDRETQMPRWRTYRAAASDAILGSYAVKQVLLAGGPVDK